MSQNGVKEPSDALVFFGATGDLAYKKIFPALHGMIRRGALDVPIIAVAKESWSLEQLRARATAKWLQAHGAVAAHARGVIADIRAQQTGIDFASLTVALQAVRRLVATEG